MHSSSLKRQNPRSCRSHGAWPIIWFGHYYKHGAPIGACALSTVEAPCKVQRGHARSGCNFAALRSLRSIAATQFRRPCGPVARGPVVLWSRSGAVKFRHFQGNPAFFRLFEGRQKSCRHHGHSPSSSPLTQQHEQRRCPS
jgi:hypothetical protein